MERCKTAGCAMNSLNGPTVSWVSNSRVTQQTLNSYETGRRRVPVSLLPALAKRLGVAVEAILDDDTKAAAKRGPVPKLQQQMDRITQLPRARQQFVMEVIESVLAQASR